MSSEHHYPKPGSVSLAQLLPEQRITLSMCIHSMRQFSLEEGTHFMNGPLAFDHRSNHVNKKIEQELTLSRHCTKQHGAAAPLFHELQ